VVPESGQVSETEVEQASAFFFGELKDRMGIRFAVGHGSDFHSRP
jgi:hypothetical protein